MPDSLPTFLHAAGPVSASVKDFGERHDGPCDAMILFGGGVERMPDAMQGALAGHIARGDRVLLLTHTAAQQAWVKAQVAVLLAAGGRA